MSLPVIVQVAVFLPLTKTFSYLWPFGEQCPPSPGLLLRVPFGSRSVFGFLLRAGKDGRGDGLKAVTEIVDGEPLFPLPMAAFFERVAHYYHHPIGEVISTALPPSIFAHLSKDPAPEPIYFAEDGTAEPTGRKQRQILEWLRRHGATPRRQLTSQFAGAAPVLKRLVAMGMVSREDGRKGWTESQGAGREESIPPRLTPD